MTHPRFDYRIVPTVWHPHNGFVGSYVVAFPFVGLLATRSYGAIVREGDHCSISGK